MGNNNYNNQNVVLHGIEKPPFYRWEAKWAFKIIATYTLTMGTDFRRNLSSSVKRDLQFTITFKGGSRTYF